MNFISGIREISYNKIVYDISYITISSIIINILTVGLHIVNIDQTFKIKKNENTVNEMVRKNSIIFIFISILILILYFVIRDNVINKYDYTSDIILNVSYFIIIHQ